MEKNNIKQVLYVTAGALAMLIGTSISVRSQDLRSFLALMSFVYAVILFIYAIKEERK